MIKLQFDPGQPHQLAGVAAVVRVFEGQPLGKAPFSVALTGAAASGSIELTEQGVANQLTLSPEQLLDNVRAVQRANHLPESAALAPLTYKRTVDDPVTGKTKTVTEALDGPHLTVEMETGTGKTYTYLRTIYELSRTYGFRKFVIVVPSVAIREGTWQALTATREHLQALYGAPPVDAAVYDSGKLTTLRQFATADSLQILVLNIDAFASDATIIRKVRESGVRPIDYIQGVRPIVIVDEPQNMESDARKAAIADLNPLCTLRYSATHKALYNQVYSLNPVQAYDLGLVKQIAVDGITADGGGNAALVEVRSFSQTTTTVKAKIRILVNKDSGGPAPKDVTVKPGDDLYRLSAYREQYRDGYVVNSIDPREETIELSSGRLVRPGDGLGGVSAKVIEFQIEQTIKWHFDRMRRLRGRGIKVLSLFFLDRVASYRVFDEGTKTVGPGPLVEVFERAFRAEAAKEHNTGLVPFAAHDVHDGYFSQDKKTGPKDTKGDTQADRSTYELIMQKKELLLDAAEPVQFIFSHSALSEGWDNPNVFQICTINQTQSETRKRQQIGRGLRLPVDRTGRRVQDKEVNVLTVIANESYETFAKALQAEIEAETGVEFQDRIKPADRPRERVRLRKELTRENCPLFFDIWDRIKHRTRYRVELDSDALVAATANDLRDHAASTATVRPKLRALKKELSYGEHGITGKAVARSDRDAEAGPVPLPDVYAYIQERVEVARPTIFRILRESERVGELLINPQMFLDTVVAAIRRNLDALQVAGIRYERIAGAEYEMQVFKDEEIERYVSSLVEHTVNPERTIYTYTPVDSGTERTFAQECEIDENVKFFFKLPRGFCIPTPLGHYLPDWAVLFARDARIYFVAETKSDLEWQKLRPTEQDKIACGKAHFALFTADGVQYKPVESLAQLTDGAGLRGHR